MTIRIDQVKTLCTGSEVALVQASRKPGLDKLTLAQARQHAQRARKLFDKWQGQSRSQARTAGARGKSTTDAAKRSVLKAEIFRDALANFEAQVAALEATGDAAAAKPARGASKKRSAPHRASRAATRATLTAAKSQANEPRKKAKAGSGAKAKTKAAAKAQPPKAAAKPVKPAKVKKASPAKASSKAKAPAVVAKGSTVTPPRQRAAKSAAKIARLDRTGLTSRVRGHVSARGRRAQGKRDSRG